MWNRAQELYLYVFSLSQPLDIVGKEKGFLDFLRVPG